MNLPAAHVRAAPWLEFASHAGRRAAHAPVGRDVAARFGSWETGAPQYVQGRSRPWYTAIPHRSQSPLPHLLAKCRCSQPPPRAGDVMNQNME